MATPIKINSEINKQTSFHQLAISHKLIRRFFKKILSIMIQLCNSETKKS